MRMEIRQGLQIEQQLLFTLRQELAQILGHFEKQILDKVEFKDIDFSKEGSEYHLDMLRALIMRESEDKESLLAKIIGESGITEEDIQKVEVDSFTQKDIDFDLGTKRHVDRIILILKDGSSAVMTVKKSPLD